jgi:manganese efflux pump family protein
MNFAATALLALAMSTDAFAAAIGKGATLHKPRISEALRTGAIFGIIEATTPLIGWGLGITAAKYVEAFDHWIAFALLAGIGVTMIYKSLAQGDASAVKPSAHSLWVLVVTGLGTSIDAMAVGVGLAFIDVNILPVAAAIGFSTFVLVTLGVMLGRGLGTVVGQRAELAAGILLILIGAWILMEHLRAAP